MNIRNRLLISAVVIACIVGVALATPIVGLLFANILASGTSNTKIHQHVRVAVPPVVGQEEAEDEWSAKLITSGPSNFIVQDVSYLPGGHTGWHSHPGILLITVTEGSIEWYDQDCERTVYNVGDSLTENTQPHFVGNVGSVNGHVRPCEGPAATNRPASPCVCCGSRSRLIRRGPVRLQC